MTPEEVRATARLVVEYVRARAEVIAIGSLLTTYRNIGNPVPATWEKDLEGMRQLPPCCAFLDSFEPEMSQVSQDASESHLIALLKKIERLNRSS